MKLNSASAKVGVWGVKRERPKQEMLCVSCVGCEQGEGGGHSRPSPRKYSEGFFCPADLSVPGGVGVGVAMGMGVGVGMGVGTGVSMGGGVGEGMGTGAAMNTAREKRRHMK